MIENELFDLRRHFCQLVSGSKMALTNWRDCRREPRRQSRDVKFNLPSPFAGRIRSSAAKNRRIIPTAFQATCGQAEGAKRKLSPLNGEATCGDMIRLLRPGFDPPPQSL